MTDNKKNSALEDARARLENALSRLAQGVASSRETIGAASQISEEKAALADRITTLEQENLKLHEQVATLSLQDNSAIDDKALTTIRAEKEALEQNYTLLKRQYANLQDELEAAQNALTPIPSDEAAGSQLVGENAELKKAIMALQAERDGIRSQLDGTIGKLETLVGEA